MRTFAFTLIALAGIVSSSAAPQAEMAHNRAVRWQAVKLFQAHEPDQAVAQLRANVHVLQAGDDRDVAVVQELIETAYDFYNSSKPDSPALAQTAATQALAVADQLLSGKRPSRALAKLYTNLGQMCERVLADPTRAQACYTLATQADNSFKAAQARLQRMNRFLSAHPQSHR